MNLGATGLLPGFSKTRFHGSPTSPTLSCCFLVGSDVQRRIADAMAGMLKAGGRAMTGTDATSSGGAIGGAADHPNRHGPGVEGYRAVAGQVSPSR